MKEIISRKDAIAKGMNRYFTGKPCKHGHISERYTQAGNCDSCQSIKAKRHQKTEKYKIYVRKYRQSEHGRKIVNEAAKRFFKTDKGKLIKKRFDSSEKGKILLKTYQKSEKGKLTRKRFLENNPHHVVAHNLRTQLRLQLYKVKSTKEESFSKLLGCDVRFLKKYIEKQFIKKMSWDNYGEWHVDHIVPFAYFMNNYDFTQTKIQKIACHYSNLQPMWAKENISKSDKISKQVAKKKIAEIKKLINA